MHSEESKTIQEYKQAEKDYKANFHTSDEKIYYIVSKKFLDMWKRQIGYDGQPPTNEPIPKNLQSEILLDKPNLILKYEPVDSNMWNYIVDPDLQEGQDYEIVNEAMWVILNSNHSPGKTILRDSNVKNGIKTVNVKLMKLMISPVFPNNISKFKNNRNASLLKGDQYVSRTCTLKDYIDLFQRTLQTVTGVQFLKQNSVRFYKCPPDLKYEDIEKLISEQLKDASHYDDPMFEIKDSEYLDPEKYETMEDCNIEPNQIVMMDGKESQKNWCIKNLNFPTEGKCEGCYNYKILQFPCECKKVSYCTDECKKKDEQYHQSRCEKTDSDDEIMDNMVRSEISVDGKCGLRNLGNTCFMNSGLQCLSNTPQLNDYILQGLYKDDINEDNPLGTKGELCTKYAHLIKRLWYSDKTSHPPFSFKKVLGKFQPQFQGYQQHDSQEFISYLLDGLHEDLNRIKKKPYVEAQDHQGRPDHELAKEAWDNFRLRNDSVIVDNMYGLYKSQLKCPTCDKQSITFYFHLYVRFDPFMMVNVSIPQTKKKKLELNLISNEVLWDAKTLIIEFDKSSTMKVSDLFLLSEVQDLIGPSTDINSLILTATSSYNTEDITLDAPLKSLKQKLKFKKFFIRKALIQEQVPQEKKIGILIRESYKQYEAYTWKRDLTPALTFLFGCDSTPKDIHVLVFQIHIGILQTFEGLEDIQAKIDAEGVDQVYNSCILDQVWSLEFKSNQRYQQDCCFCNASQCSDCKVPLDGLETLESIIAKDKEINIEVYVVWKRGYTKEGRQEDIYDDWLKAQSKFKMQVESADADAEAAANGKGVARLSLQECLKFSSQPEQLEVDNTWYCSVCQDHVQAFKTMEIYTTPKILVFHLKRFKNSSKYFKSKLETLIDFPIDDFNMNQYCKDSNLPQELSRDRQSNSVVKYDLYAVSNHFGGLGGGHYTASARNRYDNQWYNFDDSHVTHIADTTQLITSAAYVLFYMRKV